MRVTEDMKLEGISLVHCNSQTNKTGIIKIILVKVTAAKWWMPGYGPVDSRAVQLNFTRFNSSITITYWFKVTAAATEELPGLGPHLVRGWCSRIYWKLHCEHGDSSLGISLPAEPIFRWLIVRKRVRLSLTTQYDAAVIVKFVNPDER